MSEFDAYDKSYKDAVNASLGFTGLKVDFFTRVKADYLLDLMRARLGDPRTLSVLDLGCGIGQYGGLLGGEVGRLSGVDVSARCIDQARATHPACDWQAYDGVHIPHADASFDLVYAVCVYHHIPPAQRAAVTAEARRVLKPGGLFAIFEHNPWNPLTRHVVNNCEFDADAVLLTAPEARGLIRDAGFTDPRARYILSVPARGRALRAVDRVFSHLPAGAQYYALGTR
jgi:SAM-dependent methyltransferase